MDESAAVAMVDSGEPGRFPARRVKGPTEKLKVFLFLILLAIGSTGCMDVRVEAQVTIDVQPNGSSTFSAAMGMSRGLRNLLEGQDEDPMLLFTRSLSREDAVILRKWDDGELEWVEGSVPFANLKELNQHMRSNELISDFSLVRQKSLLKDRFVLDAVINPVIEDADDPLIDPSGFLDFQVIVRLPGEVVETNGFYDLSLEGVAWSINGKEQQNLHAVSELENWGNLGILLWVGAVAFLVFLLAVALTAVFLNRSKRRGAEA